jgi:cation transport ATPase
VRELDVLVRVVRGEQTEQVAATEVKAGERILVEEGEVIGADGLVLQGEARVVPWIAANTDLMKHEGDAVVAGARVVSGRLALTVTWGAHDRAWAKLALSPSSRVDVTAPLTKIARLVAVRGAPFAGALAAASSYATTGSFVDVGVALCAGALACGASGVAAIVALSHAEGHAQALAHGIVYKDAAGFDRAGRTDVAVVCSRGTVLMGEPEIVALETLETNQATPQRDSTPPSRRPHPVDVGRLIALAAGAETASTHPFAAAVLRGAHARKEIPENVRNAQAHAGLGVTALTSTGERLIVGSRALLLREKVSVAIFDARVAELEAQGRSVLLVALGGRLVGLLALQDGLRPGARAAVQRLLDARIEPVLLSGEARETCETIGRALEIEHVRPEVLPADRGIEVRALAEGGHVVAVLGHPSTDDGALGAADVAIAMGAAGGVPGEWTVQLASDDVRDAALALSLPHATRDRARRALVAGLVAPVAALLAIAFGFAPAFVAPLAGAIGTVIALKVR